MKILIAHNHYKLPGGEDRVVASEASLLERKGHDVLRLIVNNGGIQASTAWMDAFHAIWNRAAIAEVRQAIRSQRPNVVHVHNTLAVLSPAVFHVAKSEGVPAVHTLHNYRLLCPNGLLYRDGAPCEDCVGRPLALPGIRHGCYRDSRTATSAVAAVTVAHRLLGTWTEKVDFFIALTSFARDQVIRGGLPAEKVLVKPNFVEEDPGRRLDRNGAYGLFVGRLTREKGVETLLSGWQRLNPSVPLKLAGDGPHTAVVEQHLSKLPSVEFLGRQSYEKVVALMKSARFLVFPSEWYEALPLTIIEAFACGTPVIASNLGAMASLVVDGHTGLHFRPGDPVDLATQVAWAWAHPHEMAEMGRNARLEYEAKYTAEINYEMLMNIYQKAIG